jgi:hypothetical protein
MTSPSPIPDNATIRSDSVASTRDSASLLAELASQAIALLNKADPPTVVTGLLKEKSYLHTQNGQLWRLVDKQRAAYHFFLFTRVETANVVDSSTCNEIIKRCCRIKINTKLD